MQEEKSTLDLEGRFHFELYFKPGDRVRCIRKGWENQYSGVGEVVIAPDLTYGIEVKFGKDVLMHWPEDSLELVTDENR